MNIELENNSAPPFVKFLNERDIEAVAFDVDNTLIATTEYYNVVWSNVGIEVAKYVNTYKSFDIVGEEYKELLWERYKRRDRKPEDIVEQVVGGLKEYFGYITKDMKMIAVKYLKNFYNTSPNPYDSAYDVLKVLNDNGKKFVFCSHAQDNWTKVKVDIFEKELNIEIPYVAVEIDMDKDSESWLKSVNLINTDISKTLVIGDSIKADILPAIEAGCKCVIWIDRYNTGLKGGIEIPEDVELFVINDIAEVTKLGIKE